MTGAQKAYRTLITYQNAKFYIKYLKLKEHQICFFHLQSDHGCFNPVVLA
jgi:hypothetical protein